MGFKEELFYAVSSGNIELAAQTLLLSPIHVNTQNNLGQTAIYLATSYCDLCMSKILIAFGADPNIEDKDGVTAISIATFNKDKNMINILNAKKEDIKYPIHAMSAKESFFYAVCYQDIKRIISILVYSPNTININTQNERGETAIHLAVSNNDLCMLKILVAFGADLNIKSNNYGYTALSIAVFNDNLAMVQVLLKLDARSDIGNDGNNLPIHIAAQRKSLIILEKLLAQNTINMKNHNGFTPLHLAIKCNNVDAVRKIAEYCHADINIATELNGDTALVMAAKDDKPEIAEILLGRKADPNLKNHAGQTFCELATSQEMKRLAISMNLYGPVLYGSASSSRKRPIDRSNNGPLESKRRKFIDKPKISSCESTPCKSLTCKRKSLLDISNGSPNTSDINSLGSSTPQYSISVSDMGFPRPAFSKFIYRHTKSSDISSVSSSELSFSKYERFKDISDASSAGSLVSKFGKTLNIPIVENVSSLAPSLSEPSILRSVKRIRLG